MMIVTRMFDGNEKNRLVWWKKLTKGLCKLEGGWRRVEGRKWRITRRIYKSYVEDERKVNF
jgi:hypothetical protein